MLVQMVMELNMQREQRKHAYQQTRICRWRLTRDDMDRDSVDR